MGCGLAVVDDRVGRDEHSGSCPLSPPAEVEIIPEELELGVEAAEEVPDLPSDEHAGRTDGEHIADTVVLPLIVLAALEAGETSP